MLHSFAGMSVEINTWFIIARRRWNHPLICSIFFYITWFGIRLILYPYLLLKFYQEYMDFSEKIGTYYNIIAVAPIFQVSFLFTLLNIYSTAQGSQKIRPPLFFPSSSCFT